MSSVSKEIEHKKMNCCTFMVGDIHGDKEAIIWAPNCEFVWERGWDGL